MVGMETPRFEYSKSTLTKSAKFLTSLKAPSGMVVAYPAKANTHPEIIRIFDKHGMEFDACSSYEAQDLLDIGVSGKKIHLSSQQHAHNLQELVDAGVHYTATSKSQLEQYAALKSRPDSVGLRINPGVGVGFTAAG